MALLLVHLAATWFLAGLIWVIQLVHYPLFAAVERADLTVVPPGGVLSDEGGAAIDPREAAGVELAPGLGFIVFDFKEAARSDDDQALVGVRQIVDG